MKSVIEMIKCAWKGIENDFDKGLINNERCLQAILYYYLRKEKDGNLNGCNVFVEPVLDGDHIDELKGKKPDLIISDRRRNILAIIELKCNAIIIYKKDFDKFRLYEKAIGKNLWIKLDKKNLGQWNKKESFKITARTKYLFLAIGNQVYVGLYKAEIKKAMPKYPLYHKTYLGYGRIDDTSKPRFGFEEFS